MSFMENFEKELNGMRASEGKSAVKVSSGSKSSSKSTTKKKKKNGFMDNFYEELSSIADDDIGPVYDRARNRMTVKGDAEEDDGKLDFFQKGLFEDGYQAGDITKTILGTAGDAALGVVKGVGSLVEGVADLGQYGVAGVADLLGKEDVAEEWKKSAKWNLVDSVTKDATDYLDQYSVLGRTSEAILQGVGQVGGIVATGGLGAAAGLGTAGTTALTTGVMGLSSMGSGMGEAYQGGATDEEAVTYGLISGAADALTEMMFGGLGKAVNAVGLSKGLLSADDMLAKAVSKKFSNQIAKNFAEFGVKASAEGLEEVVAGVAQAMGKKFTYMSEKDFKDILEDENLLEQFIVGSATSGMIQSGIIPGTKKGSLIEANKNESDFLTGTTKNEQAVIQKEVENRVADKEKDGKKLTKKEKAAIEEQVIRDMEKGYISTDTIEEVLGGGTYNIYKSTVDSEDAILKEYEELGQKTNATLKDQARYTELTQQVKDIREKSQRDALKTQLGQEVSELVKGDRLAESYNERARRGEAYQADLTKYDAKQQAVIQKAIDSGILNNTNRTHEFVDLVSKISADKGVLFDFTNNQKLKDSGFAVEGKTVNGYYDPNSKTIGVNIDSVKALNFTVGHEITHVLEGTKVYEELQGMLFEYAKNKGEFDSRREALSKLYSEKDIDKELAADLVGEYLFSDTDFISNLSTKNRNVFQKVYDEIKYLCKVVTAGSKEARELERVRKAFEDAYRAGGKAQGETKYSMSDSIEEYSDMVDSDGEVLTVAQKNYFEKNGLKDDNGNLIKLYRSADGGRTVWDGRGAGSKAQGIYLTDDVYVARAFASDGRKVGDVLEVYANAQNPLIIDAEGSNYMDIPMPENAPEWLEDSGDWEGRLNADQLPVDAFANGHDAVIIKNVREGVGGGPATDVILRDSNQMKRTDNKNPSSDPDIRYSLSDSDGRQLTKEQQEYFKDSKMRDENGNLKVMYHGTPNGDFTIFRDGTYFTDNKEYADRYQNPGASSISTGKVASNPKTFEVYLDIKKPFDINDAEAREIYINDYIKGGNAIGINPYLSDAEYAKINSIDWTEGEDLRDFLIENEYDYDGLVLDEGGTGGYGDEVHSRGKSYVVFSPEQVKNVDNLKPTEDPDIRFSLSKSVEETKELLALHNLTEQKLLKSLKLGGLPMPSVAIAKAKDGHSEFGEISLILPRDSIDPETSSRNKLYSGDAWTPTYPKVDYKLNSKALKQIRDKINSLVPSNIQEFGRLHLDSDNMEDTLNRYGGDMVDAFKDNDALKYAYLMEAEADIQLPMKEKNLSYSGARENGAIIKVAEAISSEDINKALNGGSEEIRKLEPVVRKAVAEYVRETYGDDQFILDTFAPEDGLSFSDLDGYLVEARKYLRTGVEQTVDTRPARELIRDMTVQYSYEEWLRDLFSGIAEKEGIRNDKDYFTPSGNRRSFEALHYEHNLENVIKAMREKGEKGIGFGGGSIFGAATTEFSSVDEMKRASGRLQQMTEEEYQEIKDGFTNRFFELASSLPKNKSSFMATDDAANTLVEAVAKYNTKRGIANYLKRELDGWANYSPQVVDDLLELVNDIRSMPTGYFEAKPQRAVGFDEVGVFVIPYDADVKLKQELLNRGYSIAEYDPKVEGDRQRVVNQFEEYKFSLSNVGEVPVRPNYRVTMGEDIALDGIAPTAEESSAVAKNATAQTISETETVPEVTAAEMSELFPDEGDDSQVELDNLHARSEALENRMLEMGETGDFTDLAEVNDEWMAVQARMAVLEAELAEGEADRIGSLEDADVPPEMDAPYVGRNEVTVDNPLADRNWDDVTGTKNRSVKSFMAENPDFKPYFKAEAQVMLGELMDSQKAELIYNDQLHYDSGGEQGWMGHKRLTSRSIETLLDDWGMKWDEVQRGLEAIIAGNGAENITPAKKIEFMLNERLLNGYTDFYTRKQVPPNQDYINFLNERQVNQQAQTQFDSFMETADMYAPEDIAPVLKKATPDTQAAPIFESTDPGTIKGQTTMFEPKKPPVGKTARVLTEERKVNKKTSKIWSMIQEHFLDNGMVFENVSKKTGNRELEAKWNFIRYSRGKAQRMIGEGTDGVRSLKDIKKEVDKSGKTEAFFDYLYHRHNEDRMSLDRRFGVPNKAVYGDHVTADVSRAMYTQLEKKNPEFKKWANDIYAYNKHLRNLLVENDVISKETAALWQKMYPHYVPVGRVDQDGLNINVPLDSRKTGVNNPVKRATGGNQDMRPLFNVMAERTAQTYRAIARNSFGIELKKTLGSVVEHNAQALDEVIDSIGDDNVLLKPGMNGQNPTFTVFENGERVEFEITEEMFNALKPTSEGLMYRNKILNGASSVFRGLTTQYSIPFMATNAIKDAQDVLINSQHPLRTYANFPRAQFQQLFRGKWYQEYMENGGEDNTYFDNETSDFKEDNWFMKGVKLPLKAISVANNFIEMTPRLAEYIASREAGRSVEVSMLDAARVTTNFAAGGDVTKFANANGATFLNASVQGAVQQVRNIREAHQKGLAGYLGLAARFAVAGLPAILLNNMLWDDDEEYEELADYVKQDYYVVGKYDDGKFIRIPKGRTVAVIQNAIEQVQNAATGDDEVDFGEFLKLVVNNLAPNNPLTNNILAPIGQVMSNETWYGEELVDYYMQQLPEMEQYDENTSSASIKLSQKINELTGAEISPVKIDYLLNQYSGGIGDVLLPMSTPKAEHGDDSTWGNITAPLKDKFTTDSVLNSKRSGEYKEAKNAAHKAAKSKNATDEDILRSQYFYAKSDEMSELYDQKREIQNSDLPDSEKYEKSREIQAKINAIAEEALSDNANVDIDGYYATVGDKRFDYSDFNGRWYEIEGEYLEREQNAIKRYGITPSDYWNDTDLYYHADYYFTYSPELETVSRNVFEGKWFAGYAAEVSQIKGDDLNGDGKTDSGTKKKKVFSYIEGLDIDDIEKKILRKMSYPSEDDYNYEIIDYLNSRSDISYEDKKTILEALDFTVDSEGYIEW